ncbi:MAG: hypothetical protein ACRDHY_04015 [Anaerolineales bacterium]
MHWYNEVHYHSGIGYLRPADLHYGNQHVIVERRQAILDAAAAAHPERFTQRPTPPKIPTKAWINKAIHPICIETRQSAIDRFRDDGSDEPRPLPARPLASSPAPSRRLPALQSYWRR